MHSSSLPMPAFTAGADEPDDCENRDDVGDRGHRYHTPNGARKIRAPLRVSTQTNLRHVNPDGFVSEFSTRRYVG